MDLKTLEYAKCLAENIRRTENILNGLMELKDTRRPAGKDNSIDDGQYFLSIKQHRDGSGPGAEMCRYLGNAEVVDAVINIVERQLKEQQQEFNSL